MREGDTAESLSVLKMRDPAVDLDWKVPGGEATCLHFAVGTDQWRLASDLIGLGAPVDALDSDGDTPLHAAAGLSAGGSDAVRFAVDLLKGGATIRRNHEGVTPFDKALEGGGSDADASDGVANSHGQLLTLLKKAEEELGVVEA